MVIATILTFAVNITVAYDRHHRPGYQKGKA